MDKNKTLTGKQEAELEKLNLLNKGMRDKETNLPVVSSRKIAGPVKGELLNTAEYAEKKKEAKKNRIKNTPKFKAKGGRVTLKNGGRVAKGCGAVMSDRRKKTKYF